MVNEICNIRNNIINQKPIIHCITNPISINQCANTILAVGARPIMAEHPKEVSEITEASSGLMLNIGNITDVRMESMIISLKKACEKSIPSVLDVVGAACSKIRRDYVFELLKTYNIQIIKGNYSEIMALCDNNYRSPGIDAQTTLDMNTVAKCSTMLAEKYKTVIIATGKTDILADGKKIIYVFNGTPQLTTVTGTGCMLGALCSAFASVSNPLLSAVSACAVFGICGQLAETDKGGGSFMSNLMDKLSTIKLKEISSYLNLEESTN